MMNAVNLREQIDLRKQVNRLYRLFSRDELKDMHIVAFDRYRRIFVNSWSYDIDIDGNNNRTVGFNAMSWGGINANIQLYDFSKIDKTSRFIDIVLQLCIVENTQKYDDSYYELVDTLESKLDNCTDEISKIELTEENMNKSFLKSHFKRQYEILSELKLNYIYQQRLARLQEKQNLEAIEML